MTPALKDAIADVKTAREIVKNADASLDERKAHLVTLAPVAVGDIIPVNGYTYRGKKMVVMSIFIKEHRGNDKLTFVARGFVLKKGGEPSDSMRGESEFNMNGTPA